MNLYSDSKSYTIIPNAYVIHLVATLELNNQIIFYDFHNVDNASYLFTIFRYQNDFCKYIVCVSSDKTQSDLGIQFFGVNYDGTLLQTYVIDSVFSVPITIVRSNVSLYWRGSAYSMNFTVPSLNALSQIKQSILNIFTFPSLTYVVQNELVMNFTLVKDYYFPSYMGIIVPNEQTIVSSTTWDWCQGTLVGKLNGQMVYIWNTQTFALVNQFSELDEEEEVLLSGGSAEYSINTFQKGGLISKGTYSNGLSFQANEIKGGTLNYISLKTFLPIKNYKSANAYLIAFANTRPESESGSTYAMIGFSSFQNTQQSIITENTPVMLVSEKDDTFENYNSFYYKWDSKKKVLLVFTDGFSSFLLEERGNIVLEDLLPYSLGSLAKYDPLSNNLQDAKSVTHYFQNVKNADNPSGYKSDLSGKTRHRTPHGSKHLTRYIFHPVDNKKNNSSVVTEMSSIDNLKFSNTQGDFAPDTFPDDVILQSNSLDESQIEYIVSQMPPPKSNLHPDTIFELKDLIRKQNERNPNKNSEINLENNNLDSAFLYHMKKCNLSNAQLRENFEIIARNIQSIDLPIYVAKKYYDRVRPSILAQELFEQDIIDSTLTTTIDIPGHPAYPSGHATQAMFIAELLSYYDPIHRECYQRMADEIGRNREVAGVHYRSDTLAGYQLGKFLAKEMIQNNQVIKAKGGRFMDIAFKKALSKTLI